MLPERGSVGRVPTASACPPLPPYLAVGDGVEHLADLGRRVDLAGRRGQRVGGDQRVYGHHTVHVIQHHEVFLQIPSCSSGDRPGGGVGGPPTLHPGPPAHQIPGGFCIVGAQVFHVGGKALVQPQVIPPFQGHQVPKPLLGREGHSQYPELPFTEGPPRARRWPGLGWHHRVSPQLSC